MSKKMINYLNKLPSYVIWRAITIALFIFWVSACMPILLRMHP